ncbi:prolyl oligopeptidase family serine peptidase [Tuwongella immobilis]|uniref:Peptidase S9 prolyl oligopeptidase catalytic domain-containing protein n=1 Tax=Tuwongella immobilis TaxID=692036 RepID=A0A6C2YI25_9BACT|nr:prolyl oligopeptidase family serine peptidase [Tuwongella immobilis]VIP01188.1 Uncharacterized protein OS=Pirellula staleyi (strain ATCC 27377 / DSM 6068 / ICPB 4128) GN=Psta_1487 PE=4 SV=1: Peptidase_S9 [Tuwongella immobilis]VTR97802.1 Uncharacterized protein OS=Pirellula staleyi (strain ATCC 27377 / DSM 6068 / ICPB 4128) GN=Psta_1487 PE=4 SV=1: Peptidase_S9 [Tuwongella immobilis]
MIRSCLFLGGVLLMVGCNSEPPARDVSPVEVKPTSQVDSKRDRSQTEETPRLVLTRSVVELLQRARAHNPKDKFLRIARRNNQFTMTMQSDVEDKEDILIRSRNVLVLLDKTSAAMLPAGLILDYATEDGQQGFRFQSPQRNPYPQDNDISLTEARQGFQTTLLPSEPASKPTPVQKPPAEIFSLVQYDAPPGKLAAYLTPDPKDGKKHPAIIWITGGDCNTIDAGCWKDAGILGGQSASEYRKAGLMMMFPSLRGGNDNPGKKEGFLGEVDDVLAAAAFLRTQPFIDPNRIYLGGHSTGGTLALLTAASSDAFRAVFSFGPVEDILRYGIDNTAFSLQNPTELQLRSPINWLHSIRSPVFVFEGESNGNAAALRTMAKRSLNPKLQFFVVPGANHFNILGPTNQLLAKKLLQDAGPECNLTLTAAEVNRLFNSW